MINQATTPDINELTPSTVAQRPRWLHIALSEMYVLMATPLGISYLILLGCGLLLDLPWLALRLMLAAALGLASACWRACVWLMRRCWRLARALLGLPLRWLRALWRAVRTIATSMLRDPLHPYHGWREGLSGVRSARERARRRAGATVPAQRRKRRERLAHALRRVARRAPPANPTERRRWRRWGLASGMSRVIRKVQPDHWLFTPTICWWLVLGERWHTMLWLNLALPSLEAPGQQHVSRAGRVAQLPLATVGYVLAKLPLGLIALAVLAMGSAFGALVSDEMLGDSILLAPLWLAVLAVIGYALYMLAQMSGRLAVRVFQPSPAVRRMQAAEAQVAQARLQAANAEQSRRDLIINVGHELRTPTANILGHVESLLLALDSAQGDLRPETLRRYLSIVEREAERLSLLVDDLLSVARAERAELQVVLAPVDAAGVIVEIYQSLAPLARRDRQVLLVHEEQVDLPPVYADRQRLSQVLLNLVRNAITYTPEGGIVSVRARSTDEDRVIIAVADTGSGIAPDDLERVFERFYRTDASRARASGGFGLGLAIARDLVEAMGGTITAESIVGQGSCFSVSLPVAPVAAGVAVEY